MKKFRKIRLFQANGVPSKDQILRQRDRILASEVFASSKRMSEFLDYLTTEVLSDHPPRLKELAIGVTVFGRDENFDPRIDSVVRVEAIRLRTKLREYYEDVGREDPVRIEIPKGSYVPVFTLITQPAATIHAEPSNKTRFQMYAVVLFVVVIIGGIVTTLQFSKPPDTLVATEPYSIAVLPLKDWSSNPTDYFSEAMTDVLIARLSENSKLRVTSMSSVMVYRNTELQSSQIAEQLHVEHIVAGAVFRDSGQVRITAQLIDARTSKNLWSNTYERPMINVLALQEDVASEIATQLMGKLLPEAPQTEITINPMAYEAFLKGRYWRNRLTAHGFNRGILYFQQAIDLQPDYADAYAGLAACHCRLGGHGIEVVRPDVALPEAVRLATKALELESDNAEANAVLGIIKFKFYWDADSAEQYLRRAIEKNPSLFEAYLWYSQISEGAGRQDLAVEQARLSHRINPLSQSANLNLGWQLYQAGQMAEAEIQFDKLLEFDPDFWGGHWGKGHSYRERRMYEKAIAEFANAVELQGGHSLPMASLGYTYAISGKHNEALAMIDKLIALSKDVYVSPMHIAMIYAGLDNPDAAFEWLDKAYQVRARSLAWLSVTREFDGLRNDPRYNSLVSAIGIAGK